MKVGVFDSGVGGLSVAQAIEKNLPELEIEFRNDVAHLPYGLRKPDEIYGFVVPILQSLIDDGCQILVIACNTVSTTLIDRLREQLQIPLIAVEPMVKPAAALTKTGVIAICATPTTLASQRYKWLKDTYASKLTVLEPDCSRWPSLIESNHMDEQTLHAAITDVLEHNADVVVLGCTHYHWIERDIKQIVAGKALVIQPEPAVIKQLKRVLAQLS